MMDGNHGILGFGRPMAARFLAWHGSDREFDVPRPLTHFGTREAALSAPRFRGVLMEFELDLRNPLEVPDSPGGADLWTWLRSAADRGIVSEAEFLAWERVATDEAFCRLLLSKGHDGLVYRNDREDEGSLSWVVLDGASARRLSAEVVARPRGGPG